MQTASVLTGFILGYGLCWLVEITVRVLMRAGKRVDELCREEGE